LFWEEGLQWGEDKASKKIIKEKEEAKGSLHFGG
jgi:hypothetical protein